MKGFKGVLSATLDIALFVLTTIVGAVSIVGAIAAFSLNYSLLVVAAFGIAAYGCINSAYIHLNKVWYV